MRSPQIIAVIAASVSFNPVVAAPYPIQETADIVEIRDLPFSITLPTFPTALSVAFPTLLSFPSITIPGVTFPVTTIPSLTSIFNGITAEAASLEASAGSISIPSALLSVIGQGPIPVSLRISLVLQAIEYEE
jgi:hypothetical protein